MKVYKAGRKGFRLAYFLIISISFLFFTTFITNAQSRYPVNHITEGIFFKKHSVTCKENLKQFVVDSFKVNIPAPSGICFDSEFFWISNYAAYRGGNMIYKLDSKSWEIINSISSYSQWTSGIAWDGSGLWALEATFNHYPNISLIKYSPEGVVVRDIPAVYSCYWAGIAWDGTYIYYGINICSVPESKDKSMIYKTDPGNGAIIDSIYPPSGNINGLVFDKNSFWYCDYQTSKIYNITAKGKILTSFAAPSELPSGLTIAKGYLWCLDIITQLVYQIDIGLAPSIPQNLVANIIDNCAELFWVYKPGEVLSEYKVYRGSSNKFSEALQIASVTADKKNYTDCNISAGNFWYWVSAVDSNGYESHPSSEVSVQIIQPLPKDYELSQNYPNPFNSITTINFKLTESSNVNLKIYDVMGREIATLISEYLPAGIYSQNWLASGIESGVYFYRLLAGSFNQAKKLVIIK